MSFYNLCGGGGDNTYAKRASTVLDRTVTDVNDTLFPGITTLGYYALAYCKNLNVVRLPNVTTVGDDAFHGSGAAQISLAAATTLGQTVFDHCKSLWSVYLPLVTVIPRYTFDNCVGMEILNIDGAQTISDYAFNMCSKLKTLKLPSAVTIGGALFSGAESSGDRTITIGSNITKIDSDAFDNLTGTVNINRAANAITGAPWGGTGLTINWTGSN